jgi:uncharacterized protein (DUF427 family)
MNRKRVKPKPGQESVWDYPRPPRLEEFSGHIRIIFKGEVILDTNRAFRILETSHPPTYYLPMKDFRPGVLQPAEGLSFCEFKGEAHYYDIVSGNRKAVKCAWTYPEPRKAYSELKDHVAVYAHFMEACYVNDEKVQSQEGDFYGGWITSNIVGPFKGAPGTWGW